MSIKLILPYPPQANNLTLSIIVKGRPIRVPSSDAKKYKATVAKICLAERVKPIAGDLKVTVRAYRPRRIGDLDNLHKAVFDGLKGHAWHDDKQVIEIHSYRYNDKNRPRLEIDIESAENLLNLM